MNTRIMAVAIDLLSLSLLTFLTVGLSAQPPQQQLTVTPGSMKSDKFPPHKKTDSPLTEEAQGGLIWFTDQAQFEAFMQDQGKVLKGTEDFEESTLNPNTFEVFDDPLESGVPNLPDAFPFPNGMTGLPNLIVQSNLGGGNPSDENPRGVGGLAALSAGIILVVSDVVTPTFLSDSFDMIFTDPKSGVGLNTVSQAGVNSVQVRVYSTTNVLLGMMTTPADPSGANFIGVSSSVPIGRINVFALDDGIESADNIQAWEVPPPPCPWDLDLSGNVSVADLLILFAQWGTPGPADFDESGAVDTNDVLILFANWGACP